MEDITQRHRLASINEIKNHLKLEIDKSSKTLKKYQKIYNVVNAISVTTGSLAGGSSIVTLSSVANPLITIPSASASSILGGVSFVTGLWNRILLNKVRKHEEILSTAESKLNSIEKTLSQSLDDAKITADEHLACLAEFSNYNHLKLQIRKKFNTVSRKSKSLKRDE